MPSSKSKKDKAKELYETQGMHIEDLARILNVKENTVKGWIDKGNWKKSLSKQELSEGKKFAKTAVATIKENSKNKLLIEMAQPTLELAFENLHGKLLLEKQTQEFSNIRDYAGLIGKLMETIGKITGETTGDLEKAEVEVKRQTLSVLNEISEKMKSVSGKQLTASSETIDLEKYEVKVVDSNAS